MNMYLRLHFFAAWKISSLNPQMCCAHSKHLNIKSEIMYSNWPWPCAIVVLAHT